MPKRGGIRGVCGALAGGMLLLLAGCGSSGSGVAASSQSPTIFYVHSVAFKNMSSGFAWGNNSFNQVGDKTTDARYSPVSLGDLKVIDMSAGGTHTLALDTSGAVWAWGNNGNGQLGNGDQSARNVPTQVYQAAGGKNPLTGVTAVAGGGLFSLVLASDGTVWSWGDNTYGELGYTVNALTQSGTLAYNPTPLQVKNSDGTVLSGVQAIAAGSSHALAIVKGADGVNHVYAWGLNNFGQLGQLGDITKTTGQPIANASAAPNSAPTQVTTITGNVIAIAAGGSSSYALTDDGTLWAWGYNDFGQLGYTRTLSSYNHNYGTDSSGNTLYYYYDPTPKPVPGFSGLTTFPAGFSPISAGLGHILAVGADGKLYAWGFNKSGELGLGFLGDGIQADGDGAENPTPKVVNDSNGNPMQNIVYLRAIGYHSLARTADGTLWAWGDNLYGQLGIGSTDILDIWRTSPVQVTGF